MVCNATLRCLKSSGAHRRRHSIEISEHCLRGVSNGEGLKRLSAVGTSLDDDADGGGASRNDRICRSSSSGRHAMADMLIDGQTMGTRVSDSNLDKIATAMPPSALHCTQQLHAFTQIQSLSC